MLVKKINPEWFPSENRYLAVGETVEITDAYKLIVDGDVVAVDAEGNELSAYDLYGVMTDREMEEFREYKKIKGAQEEQKRLVKEQQVLQEQLNSAITPINTSADKVTTDTPWRELTNLGNKLGVYKVGMSKDALIEAINNA